MIQVHSSTSFPEALYYLFVSYFTSINIEGHCGFVLCRFGFKLSDGPPLAVYLFSWNLETSCESSHSVNVLPVKTRLFFKHDFVDMYWYFDHFSCALFSTKWHSWFPSVDLRQQYSLLKGRAIPRNKSTTAFTPPKRYAARIRLAFYQCDHRRPLSIRRLFIRVRRLLALNFYRPFEGLGETTDAPSISRAISPSVLQEIITRINNLSRRWFFHPRLQLHNTTS